MYMSERKQACENLYKCGHLQHLPAEKYKRREETSIRKCLKLSRVPGGGT